MRPGSLRVTTGLRSVPSRMWWVAAAGRLGRMITVESLTKQYGGVAAVDDVSFTAEPGRVTGFLGPNGAGKSTTLRVVVGVTPATSGTATVARRDRKSTRLISSHANISYAVFCLKKKKETQ